MVKWCARFFKEEEVHTYFSVPVSMVSVEERTRGADETMSNIFIFPFQNQTTLAHFRVPGACEGRRARTRVIVDLLAFGFEDDGRGSSHQEDGQQNPPQPFVCGGADR